MIRRMASALVLCAAALVSCEVAMQAQARPAAEAAAQAPAPAAPAPLVPSADARQTREQLRELLGKYPPDLGRILQLDPTMMQNPAYLAQYPELASFLAAHPDVARNPRYYLNFVRQTYDWNEPPNPDRQALETWDNLLDGMAVFTVMVFVGGLLAWLVRTLLDHRRWLRISRVQTEVHHKLLDRFTGTNELLAYIQTPAGQRFLEAPPTPGEMPSRPTAAPIGRILWSIQIGVVLTIGGLGFQFISGRVIEQVAEGLWMIGVLAIAFGVGFILSGAMAFVLSRKLGLFDSAGPPTSPERGGSTPA